METDENGIEHQATVDKGLKMKIKRKQPGGGGGGGGGSKGPPETKTRTVNDDANRLAKSAVTNNLLELMTDGGGDSKPVDDDVGSGSGGSDGPTQRSQKRKRNNKTGKSRDADSAAAEKPNNSENENRVRGRDLCQFSRSRDPIGCALERSAANRKRPIGSSTQDSGNEGKDPAALYIEDKGNNKSVEYGCPASSTSGSEKSDFTCIPETAAVAADREKLPSAAAATTQHSSDPYEFILRLEDLQQIPAKKFKSEKVCGCFISRRRFLSIKSMNCCSVM